METIWAACISGGVTLLVCIITNAVQASKTRALLNYRLTELEKKQDKHNSVIERTYALEKDVAVVQDQVKSAHHRIDGLEKAEQKE